LQRGVLAVEGIWPNSDFETGVGVNALINAFPLRLFRGKYALLCVLANRPAHEERK
jgi:hypothetical protein